MSASTVDAVAAGSASSSLPNFAGHFRVDRKDRNQRRTLCYSKAIKDDETQTEPETPTNAVTVARSRAAAAAAVVSASVVIPAIIADAGDAAARRVLEFFGVTIRNGNTRAACLHAAGRFFTLCERHHLDQLADIESLHVAAYIEVLGKDFEKPTVKQHLAAIRMLFDWLVTGQVVATNPAHAVRGPKHVVKAEPGQAFPVR